MYPGGYGGHPRDEVPVKISSLIEPAEGPKSASGVSSANDITQAEESTDGRLLNLENQFAADVRIYPGQFGELVIMVSGREETINVEDPVLPGKLLDQKVIELLVDRTVYKLRLESDRYEQWIKWCRTQGLKGRHW